MGLFQVTEKFLRIIFVLSWFIKFTEGKKKRSLQKLHGTVCYETVKHGARHVGLEAKVFICNVQDPIWSPVLIPEVLLPIQLPACGSLEQPKALGLCTRLGDPEELLAPGFGSAQCLPFCSLGE